ncbi:hypothetical protein JTB14_016301 [Gonioctena quinquepunctata]|nr:hypothetical protein JTB14_016301 [Gonioctena quinquepunctata]
MTARYPLTAKAVQQLNNIEVPRNSEEFRKFGKLRIMSGRSGKYPFVDEVLNTVFEEESFESLGERETFGQKLPRIQVNLGNQVIPALMDTGASVNFIRADLLGQKDLSQLPRPTTIYLGCDNSTAYSLGHVNSEITIESNTR